MVKSKSTILVVDDEIDVREMIAVGLSLDGYDVITAEDGERAIDVLALQPVDLLITDFKMPGMSGVETATRVRGVAPDLPLIVVTGYLAPSTMDEWTALGNVVLIHKPFEFKVLAEAVESAIGPA